MIAPFILDAAGFHAETKRAYTGRIRQLVTEASDLGVKYRAMFLGQKPVSRSIPEARTCLHLGPPTGAYVEIQGKG